MIQSSAKLAVYLVLIKIALAGSAFAQGGYTPDTLSQWRGAIAELEHPPPDTVVVLDFWATWCRPCLQFHEELKKFQAEYPDAPVKVYGFSVDEDPAHWLAFMYRFQPIGRQVHLSATEQAALSNVGYDSSYLPSIFLNHADKRPKMLKKWWKIEKKLLRQLKRVNWKPAEE